MLPIITGNPALPPITLLAFSREAAAHASRTDPDPTAQHQAQGAQEQFDGLTIEGWTEKEMYPLEKRAIFRGNIKAIYGPNYLYADQLDLLVADKTGEASGNVRLVTPEGSLHCSRFHFDWGKHTGKAYGVSLEVAGTRLEFGELEVTPEIWEIKNGSITMKAFGQPLITISSPLVSIVPGSNLKAKNPRLGVLGTRILTSPDVKLSLNSEGVSLGLPRPALTGNGTLGIGWENSLILSPNANFNFDYKIFPRSFPNYTGFIAYSPLDPATNRGMLKIRDDLGERFRDSFLDSIFVRTLEAEDERMRAKRLTYALMTSWNRATLRRVQDSDSVSKRIEGVVEHGGTIGSLFGFFQARVQDMRPTSQDAFRTRGEFQGSLAHAPIPIAKNVGFRLRADAQGFTGPGQGYGWLRGQASLIYQPTKEVTLGGSWAIAREWGKPPFVFDALGFTRSFNLRADIHSGVWSLSTLSKYDLDRGRWFDHQYGLSLVADAFEPFVYWRQASQDFRAGVNIRIDVLVERLTKKEQRPTREPLPK